MGRLVSQWANGYLEREGLARLTISILVITTAGCLAYTWGYAEVGASPVMRKMRNMQAQTAAVQDGRGLNRCMLT